MIRDPSGIYVSPRRGECLNKRSPDMGTSHYLEEWMNESVKPTRYFDNDEAAQKAKAQYELTSSTFPGNVFYAAKMGVVYTVASGLLVVLGSSLVVSSAFWKLSKTVMKAF